MSTSDAPRRTGLTMTYDVRTIDRARQTGRLADSAYADHLAKLEDVSAKAVSLSDAMKRPAPQADAEDDAG